jgi:hypothetical protein
VYKSFIYSVRIDIMVGVRRKIQIINSNNEIEKGEIVDGKRV